jgi:hypothetical protein
MNAAHIIDDDMTLEEKLQAIERALTNAQSQAKEEAAERGVDFVPIDPADLTMCEGCQ